MAARRILPTFGGSAAVWTTCLVFFQFALLALHISSQYLDLAPELALQADHAGLRAALVHSNGIEAREEFSADWMLMSAAPAFFARPEIVNVMLPMPKQRGLRLWTDDDSSILPLLKWHPTGVGR